jgi:hypothetical protein
MHTQCSPDNALHAAQFSTLHAKTLNSILLLSTTNVSRCYDSDSQHRYLVRSLVPAADSSNNIVPLISKLTQAVIGPPLQAHQGSLGRQTAPPPPGRLLNCNHSPVAFAKAVTAPPRHLSHVALLPVNTELSMFAFAVPVMNTAPPCHPLLVLLANTHPAIFTVAAPPT